MLEISLQNIKKNFGFKNVLDDFSFEIMTKERVALIGINGSGKTTIFNIISGSEKATSGTVSIKKGASIGLLSQIPPVLDDNTKVIDVITESLKEVYEVEKKLRELELKMSEAAGPKLESLLKTYGSTQQKYENLNGYEIESKINKIINGFKIKQELLNRSFNSLSGGEKTIVYLASLILTEPSILLLDEPTNHLDIDTLEWFESYLKDYPGTIIISSHDRYFLDQVTNKTILIERGQAEIFHGNYSSYLKENENRIMKEFADYKNQQKQIDAMKKKIHQLQEWGKLAFPGGEPFFKRAASIQKRLDKIELLNKPQEKKELPLDFKINERSGKDVLVIDELNITLGNKDLFKNAKLKIRYNEKVCLMGKNGTGKSTLIKNILKNESKSIKLGSNVTIGHIPQEIKFEDDNMTVLEVARKSFLGDETSLRVNLAKFLFYGEFVFKKVSKLSGGEKVRLKLFELIQIKANFLILDEPTNHIDIDTKEMLEEALNDFQGTLLFISHDRYFINKLAKRVLNIENKTIIEYLGNYDYYKNHHI